MPKKSKVVQSVTTVTKTTGKAARRRRRRERIRARLATAGNEVVLHRNSKQSRTVGGQVVPRLISAYAPSQRMKSFSSLKKAEQLNSALVLRAQLMPSQYGAQRFPDGNRRASAVVKNMVRVSTKMFEFDATRDWFFTQICPTLTNSAVPGVNGAAPFIANINSDAAVANTFAASAHPLLNGLSVNAEAYRFSALSYIPSFMGDLKGGEVYVGQFPTCDLAQLNAGGTSTALYQTIASSIYMKLLSTLDFDLINSGLEISWMPKSVMNGGYDVLAGDRQPNGLTYRDPNDNFIDDNSLIIFGVVPKGVHFVLTITSHIEYVPTFITNPLVSLMKISGNIDDYNDCRDLVLTSDTQSSDKQVIRNEDRMVNKFIREMAGYATDVYNLIQFGNAVYHQFSNTFFGSMEYQSVKIICGLLQYRPTRPVLTFLEDKWKQGDSLGIIRVFLNPRVAEAEVVSDQMIFDLYQPYGARTTRDTTFLPGESKTPLSSYAHIN